MLFYCLFFNNLVNKCFVPLRVMNNFKQLPPSTDFFAANKQYFLKKISASIKRLLTPVLNTSFKKCLVLFTKVFYGNIHTVIHNISKVIYCLFNKNKELKMFGHRKRCIKKPFGYRVVRHWYLLESCQGLSKFYNNFVLIYSNTNIFIYFN